MITEIVGHNYKNTKCVITPFILYNYNYPNLVYFLSAERQLYRKVCVTNFVFENFYTAVRAHC